MKVRVLFMLLLVSVFGFAALAQARADTLSLYIEAFLTEDVKSLEKLLAGNYLHINSNGYVQDRENFLNNLREGKMVIDRLTVTDVATSHYGGATLSTGTVQFKGKFEPKLPSGLHRVTVVMERKGDEEKVILFQATRVRAEARAEGEIRPARKVKGEARP